jgi:hypothetical protein
VAKHAAEILGIIDHHPNVFETTRMFQTEREVAVDTHMGFRDDMDKPVVTTPQSGDES